MTNMSFYKRMRYELISLSYQGFLEQGCMDDDGNIKPLECMMSLGYESVSTTITREFTNSANILKIKVVLTAHEILIFEIPILTYPFRPPKLFINSKEYIYHICALSDYERDESNKEWGETCMCKISKLCHNNWYPAIKLVDIINEYKTIKEFKKRVLLKKWLLYFWNKCEIPAIELVDKICFFAQ